jgi:hypothetical protein
MSVDAGGAVCTMDECSRISLVQRERARERNESRMALLTQRVLLKRGGLKTGTRLRGRDEECHEGKRGREEERTSRSERVNTHTHTHTQTHKKSEEEREKARKKEIKEEAERKGKDKGDVKVRVSA